MKITLFISIIFMSFSAVAGFSCLGKVVVKGRPNPVSVKIDFPNDHRCNHQFSALTAFYSGPHSSIRLGGRSGNEPIKLKLKRSATKYGANFTADLSSVNYGEQNVFHLAETSSQEFMTFRYEGSYGFLAEGTLNCGVCN